MSNEIRTRRLIVTLPDASGEEADIHAADIERRLTGRGYVATVAHALDDAPLNTTNGGHLGVWPYDAIEADEDEQIVTFGTRNPVKVDGDGDPIVADVFAYLRPDEARKLAALLLRAADEAEGKR